MERCLKQYDREYMKMAMLKHEETFRQQVNELHRLYRVQKLLMNDMKKAELKKQLMYKHPRSNRERLHTESEIATPLNPDLPEKQQFIRENGRDAMLEDEEESDLELTLAIGSRQRKKKEASFTSDSASYSSSSAESSGVKLNSHEWRLLQVPDVNMSFQSERKSGLDVEEQKREDRVKSSPWLFQCLSLNMTR